MARRSRVSMFAQEPAPAPRPVRQFRLTLVSVPDLMRKLTLALRQSGGIRAGIYRITVERLA